MKSSHIYIIILISLIISAGRNIGSDLLEEHTTLDEERVTNESLEDMIVDAIDRAEQSVVSIVVTKNLKLYLDNPDSFFWPGRIVEKKAEVWWGSGIIFSKDWLIVTNKHVVEDLEAHYTIITQDWRTYDVDKIWLDSTLDLAVIRISDEDGNYPTDLAVAEFLPSDQEVQVWQFAIAIGNTLSNYQHAATLWIVSAKNRKFTHTNGNSYTDLYQVDTSMSPWNSGGPLIDIYGRVMGIATAVSSYNDGVWFVLPVTQEFIATLTTSLEENGHITP